MSKGFECPFGTATVQSELQDNLHPKDPCNLTVLPYERSAAAAWLLITPVWELYDNELQDAFHPCDYSLSWLMRVANPFQSGVKKRPIQGLGVVVEEIGKGILQNGVALPINEVLAKLNSTLSWFLAE